MKSNFDFERVVLSIFTTIMGGMGTSFFTNGFHWIQPLSLIVLSPMVYILIRKKQKQGEKK